MKKATYVFHTDFCDVVFDGAIWDKLYEYPYYGLFSPSEFLPDDNTLIQLLKASIPLHEKYSFDERYVSPENFYWLLTYANVAFSVTPKPVLVPLFDYDGLSEEEFKAQTKLERAYRAGHMLPDVTYEFPVSVTFGKDTFDAYVRFRDTAWYETDAFSVELANTDVEYPGTWKKNVYDKIKIPVEVLEGVAGKEFLASAEKCSPYEMWLRLGKPSLPNDEEPRDEPPYAPGSKVPRELGFFPSFLPPRMPKSMMQK